MVILLLRILSTRADNFRYNQGTIIFVSGKAVPLFTISVVYCSSVTTTLGVTVFLHPEDVHRAQIDKF